MSDNIELCRMGEGRRLTLPDATVTVLSTGAHAGGAYELFLVEAPRTEPAPLHAEPWAKSYHVLSGRILVRAAATGHELAAGDTITLAPGTVNSFTVLTDAATFLLIAAGTSMVGFFGAVDALGHERPPDETGRILREVADRYGVTLAAEAGAS
jgi:quercetin dioxygenase-like cupin family protein